VGWLFARRHAIYFNQIDRANGREILLGGSAIVVLGFSRSIAVDVRDISHNVAIVMTASRPLPAVAAASPNRDLGIRRLGSGCIRSGMIKLRRMTRRLRVDT
jgi:hypothetical protein